jgi:hypothetical protein
MARVKLEDTTDAPPVWLGRLVYGGLVAVLVGLGVLATGLALGWADPRRAGPLWWENDFKAGAGGWEFEAPAGVSMAPRDGALVADFAGGAAEQWAVGLAPAATAPSGDFTLEVAGAASDERGGGAVAYGLVFGWQDRTHYSALLINANGYAEAYRRDGAAQVDWFAWQQWPHILVGTENNRLRVDVRDDVVTLRVNDEIVTTTTSTATTGQVGVVAVARAAAGGRVVFSWARLWGAP